MRALLETFVGGFAGAWWGLRFAQWLDRRAAARRARRAVYGFAALADAARDAEKGARQ